MISKEEEQYTKDLDSAPRRISAFKDDKNQFVILLECLMPNRTIEIRSFGFPMPSNRHEYAHLCTFVGSYERKDKLNYPIPKNHTIQGNLNAGWDARGGGIDKEKLIEWLSNIELIATGGLIDRIENGEFDIK